MKRKRTLIKTFFLLLVRYERWKMNPKNMEKVILMELYNPKMSWI
jgi:hypothetical protein